MSLRVLHCIHSLKGGGAEKQLITLANNSIGTKLECAIYCIDSGCDDLKDSAAELYVLKERRNYPWHLVGEIRSVIRNFRPDVVHCWLPVTLVFSGLVAARLENVPVVTSYRSAKELRGVKDVAELASAAFLAKGVVSNNDPMQSSYLFRKLYRLKLSETIPNAVDVPAYYREKCLSKKINDEFTIIYVGRLVDVKNWQVMLLALEDINTARPWKLLICGKGDDEDVERMINDLDLKDNVEILGYRSDVYDLISQSDLLLLPSWKEGMPNVVLEAMSIGVPCVVSDISAHTSLFKTFPVVKYFDPRDGKSLRKLLIEIIDGEVILDRQINEAIKFTSRFSPSVLVERYINYYQEVIDN